MTAITKEQALEAVRILAGQCGNAKIRTENKKIVIQYVSQLANQTKQRDDKS